MVIPDNVQLAMLQNITETGNRFDPAALFLAVYGSIDKLDKTARMSDVHQATGDAAIRVAITAWSDPILLVDGRWCVEGPLCEFRVADDTEEQTVAGWMYADDDAGGVLLGFEEFSNPINLPDEFRVISLVPRLCIDDQGNYSATVLISP